jgi:hypothetical protein
LLNLLDVLQDLRVGQRKVGILEAFLEGLHSALIACLVRLLRAGIDAIGQASGHGLPAKQSTTSLTALV